MIEKKTRNTRFTIDDLKKEDSTCVYVLNNTSEVLRNPTNVSFVVDEVNLFVPVTFIPIDLGLNIPKSKLLESPNFLRVLNNRLLVLISSDSANAILDSSDAQAEEDRLLTIRINSPERGEENVEENKDKYIKVRFQVRNIIEDEDMTPAEKRLKLRPFATALTNIEKEYIGEYLPSAANV